MIKFIRDYMISSKKKVNPSRRIMFGFLFIICLGALLLMLPMSSKERVFTSPLTALFTATSATCVTGLVLVETGRYYSLFGQVVILMLIQVGGLGFMTILTITFFAAKKHIGIRDRVMIAQTLGLADVGGVVKVTRHVLITTFTFEGIGAILLSLRFVPQYGFIKGMWRSIFTSISAFCNAGFDIFGFGDSVCSYNKDPLVLLTISALIIMGGLGFIVWEDVFNKRSFKKLAMYSKLVIIMTSLLLVLGTIGFYFAERGNPYTIATLNIPSKFLNAFFQSVTTRTAGFDAMGQIHMTDASKLMSVILMFIGGSAGSTAGGVKTVTICIAILSTIAVLRSRDDVVVFEKHIKRKSIMHAMTLITLGGFLVIAAGLFISVHDNTNLLDAIYEVASAYGTVGLSVGLSGNLDVNTTLILMLYMFFGRVGVMTISLGFMTKMNHDSKMKYPDGNIIIG